MNSNMLRGVIVSNGLNVETVAQHLGMSHASLYHKVNGETEFKRDEMVKLKRLLKLNNSDFIKIFCT